MGPGKGHGHAESQSKAGSGKKRPNGRLRRRKRRRMAADETDGKSDEEENMDVLQPEATSVNEASEPMCSICQDSLNDARCLPRDHMFCLECIRKLVEHTSPTLTLSAATFQWRFDIRPVCPLCRRGFSVPQTGGVDTLPKNVAEGRAGIEGNEGAASDGSGAEERNRWQDLFQDDVAWNAYLELLNNDNMARWLRNLQVPGVTEFDRMLSLQRGL